MPKRREIKGSVTNIGDTKLVKIENIGGGRKYGTTFKRCSYVYFLFLSSLRFRPQTT